MSWAELHAKSEHLAAEAHAIASVSLERSRALYAEAAKLEAAAIAAVSPTKPDAGRHGHQCRSPLVQGPSIRGGAKPGLPNSCD